MNRETQLQEKKHLELIKSKIEQELETEAQVLEHQREELLKERKRMWEESAKVVVDYDDIIDLAIYDELVRSENDHYVRRDEKVRQLKYLLKTPYFGRIDFVENGETQTEQVYIGRYGFCEKRTYEYDVYDWRTPIASLFYDSGVGAASYQCPAGEIEGEVTCKRQYRILDGELVYCYDTNTAVQDDILEDVLSENTDKVLRVIVDTITKDQNRAIRQEHSTDLLVEGPAGSGKTSVGMHRLAYLLYHNREKLSREKIVIMSRNEIFSSYVSGILPELGEESVQDTLFDRLINVGISRDFKKQWYYEQMEYLLEHQGDFARKQAISVKYSKEFIQFLEKQIQSHKGKRMEFSEVLELYLEMLQEYLGTTKSEVYQYTKHCVEHQKLMYEDILVIGYLRILTGAIRPLDNISHVVIDEAQDYNILQLKIIKKMYPKSRFTILADPNQAVYPETSTTEGADFQWVFGGHLKEMVLHKSYRSTAPINRYALSLLGVDNTELYIDRPGKEPERITSANPVEALKQLLETIPPETSVGILTCDNGSAYALKKALGQPLAEERPIQYIFHPDKVLEEKIVVMPILLAKGLEFDAVIIWDDKRKSFWAEHRNLKYLMSTRALHELYFIGTTDGEE